MTKTMLCHPELGIRMECVNITLRFHHPSLMKKAIQEKVWKDTLEEEMRILYVAMTRGKEKDSYRNNKGTGLRSYGLRLQINTEVESDKRYGLASSYTGRSISEYTVGKVRREGRF